MANLFNQLVFRREASRSESDLFCGQVARMKSQDLSLKYSDLSHTEDNIGTGSSHILLCESMRILVAGMGF